MRIDRSGSERWLVVSEPPEKVWPIVKDFWQGLGFVIKTEVPEAGSWRPTGLKTRKDQTGSDSKPDRGVVELLPGERDKFRTRLERGAQPNTTEIYIPHRGGPRSMSTSTPRQHGVAAPAPTRA